MPKIKRNFPNNVHEIENLWIPMSDGTRLAARVWMPENATSSPVPAILEYIPYRKRDFMRSRDQPIHHYFAGHGYVSVRVDLRGSGDSDGLLTDEYTQQEHDDALEVIEWLAAQPWCDGNVGMMGISWGGFNALQVAARQPAHLKAIITLCASDDRYSDDAHYMGGCLLNENLTWGSVLFMFNSMPPDPEIVGERWREMWLQRLQNTPLFPMLWMQHQTRDEYWQHGSVCQGFDQIKCPVYAMGGWADGYSNAIPRLLAGLKVPRKGLIGPWAHVFPHNGVPGPTIGFLQEAVRWWDQWLKQKDTGIMQEPMYRVWMQESVPPKPFYEQRPGRWVAEREWPSSSIKTKKLFLNPRQLDKEAVFGKCVQSSSLQSIGLFSGEWCGFGVDGEMPLDQRNEDGKSLRFDSKPLKEAIEILGAPMVVLSLEVDKPVAFVAVRLNDVAPDGAATRVSYGLLNLTHRNSHEQPEAMIPGEPTNVRVKLNDIAHIFPKGHSIRIAISTTYWPIAWPSPEEVTLKIYSGESILELPVRLGRPEDNQLRVFEKPEQAEHSQPVKLRPKKFQRKIERDLTTNETVYTLFADSPEFEEASLAKIEDINLDLGYKLIRRYRIQDHDPLSAKAEVEQAVLFRRDSWQIRIEAKTWLSCTKDTFEIRANLEAFESDKIIFQKKWDESIPRKLI